MTRIASLLFMASTALVACKKENPEPQKPNPDPITITSNQISVADLSGVWELQTAAVDGDPIEDFTPTTLTLNLDMSYGFVYDFGTYQATTEGIWSWDGSANLIGLESDPQFLIEIQQVVSVDSTSLILERSQTDSYGNTSLSRFTYER